MHIVLAAQHSDLSFCLEISSSVNIIGMQTSPSIAKLE